MSFIKNMFGGGAKKPQVDPTQQKKIQDERDNLEKERAKEKLEDAVKKTEDKVEKVNNEIAQLETEVKTLIQQKRKDKATVVLKKLKGKKEILIKLQKQGNFLYKQMGMLENTESDMDLMETMKQVNAVNSKNRDKQEELTDELMKAKEMQQEADQRRSELNDLMEDDEDEDELDDMMKEYEQQANDEIAMNFNKADKDIISESKIGQTQKPQAAKKEDNFDSLMAELMN